MKVVAVTGRDKTWLDSLLLHFNVSVQFNGEEGGVWREMILGVDKWFIYSYNETFSNQEKALLLSQP